MSSKPALKIFLAATLLGGLAACGNSPVDRGISGAAIGAAAGTAGAALTDNDLGPGALVGAVVGGAVGAATNSGDFDLGTPVWKRNY